MYLSIEKAKEEIERILKSRMVLESVCGLTTIRKEKGIANRLTIDVVYNPIFSKQDADEINKKVLFRNPEKKPETGVPLVKPQETGRMDG